MWMRIPALAAATVLVFGLAACGNDSGQSPAETPGATATPAASAEATAAPGQADQSSPEAVAESALRAVGAGDARGACTLMAANGRVMSEDQRAMDSCVQFAEGLIGQLPESQRTRFENPSVTGATIDGTTASFENAQIEPALAGQVLTRFRATEINGDWYLTS